MWQRAAALEIVEILISKGPIRLLVTLITGQH
ncbi:MAG: hypothetical protein Ct9H300mP28_15120 [Pseudomonadota bacterium]|nr:MAG: hypothetical protein Ct9H300mP28_15120 [Pseudomonadota bacterium]